MGNQLSVPQRADDQENDSEMDKEAPRKGCAQNGVPVMVSTHTVQLYDEVDLGISVQDDNVATSSPKTVETSAVAAANGKDLGKEARAEAPAAKTRFFLTLSRPVPGRTEDQAADSSTAPGTLAVSSGKAAGNKEPSDRAALPLAAAQGGSPHKMPSQAPALHTGLPATGEPVPLSPESRGAVALTKPKDSSFFDKLFKLDKEQEKAPADSQQEAKSGDRQDQADNLPGCPGQARDVPAEWNIVEGEEKGQKVPPLSCSILINPEELELAQGDPPPTEITKNNNNIMSFFKTLVSPNKAEAKKDLEDTGADKSTTASADLKADKANFAPQGAQGAAKNPTPTETPKEGVKQKGGPSPLPLSKLFWKKSIKEDSVPTGAEENVVWESPVEVAKSQEVESALQTVDLSEDGAASPEPPEVKLKREERRPPRASLMALLRQMSVRGDGGTTHSEEINGKDTSYQASDPSERAATPPEPEPAGANQKGKEGSSKDKKMTAEAAKQRNSRQEAREPARCTCACAEAAAAGASALQRADKPQKQPEKRRQSLGGFFKGLGPKRMSDAQVQTDPVSIGPVGKSK